MSTVAQSRDCTSALGRVQYRTTAMVYHFAKRDAINDEIGFLERFGNDNGRSAAYQLRVLRRYRDLLRFAEACTLCGSGWRVKRNANWGAALCAHCAAEIDAIAGKEIA